MDNNKVDITLVVDRSGSMDAIRSDAEGGVNRFIEEQKAAPGDATLTLVQFDDEYEQVYCKPIKEAPRYTLVPRGWTALLDAVGKAVNAAGERLSALDESARPGCVIFVIVTDGHENRSREFTKARIKEMIEHQQSVYNWKFTFLGADASAFDEGRGMGVPTSAIASYNTAKSTGMYEAVCDAVCRMRSATARGMAAQTDFAYTNDERSAME